MVLACHFTKSSKGQFSETDRSDQNNNKKTKTKKIQKTFFLNCTKTKKARTIHLLLETAKKKKMCKFHFISSFRFYVKIGKSLL